MPTEATPAWTPPYMPFRTLLNLFERMEADGGAPPQIDRSYLNGSEGTKTQVMAGMRALGLIGEQGQVRGTRLDELIQGPERRKAALKAMIERHYPRAVELGRLHGTQSQLEAAFDDVQGVTRRKAIAFYLHAAKYAEVGLSRNFKAMRSSPAGRTTTPGLGKRNGTVKRRGKQKPNSEPLKTTVTPTDSPEALRARYIDMLLKRVETNDLLDPDLLNRIEGLLGYKEE